MTAQISDKYTYKGDSKEIEQRIICLTDKVSTNVDRVSTNIEGVSINVSEVSTNVVEEYQQKVKDNNTSINNTFNNKKEIKKEYFLNDAINEIFTEFINQRKKLKAVNSERAINTLINKLNKYDDETKYKMIENSIVNSWKDVYELKENKKTGNKEIIPEWFDKKIEKEEMKDEDLEDIMKELQSFG